MTESRDLGGGAKLFVESSPVLPLVSVLIAFRSGSARDPEGQEGLSRVTARLMRRGCAGLDSMAIERTIDRLGGEIGFDVAASSTAIAGQVLTRNLDAFVDLIAKLISTPTFADDELQRLVRETRAELLESLDNDRGLADRFFRKKLFANHAYGRSVRGSAASLAKIDVAAVRAHHAAHYGRADAVIAMAGDIDIDTAERLAKQLVSALPNAPAAPDGLVDPTPIVGRHLVFVDKPERTQTQILIGALGTSAHDPDHIPLSVANAIFGGTFTSRLTREVRGKRGWSYGASSRMGVDRKRHSFVMWTFPASTDAAPCIALEIGLLEKLIDAGVTEREVKFVQKYLTRSWAFEVDTAQKRMQQSLDVELIGLPADYYTRYLEAVNAVTAESANAALKARLNASNLLVTIVGTASATLDAVKAVLPSLETTNVIAYDSEAR